MSVSGFYDQHEHVFKTTSLRFCVLMLMSKCQLNFENWIAKEQCYFFLLAFYPGGGGALNFFLVGVCHKGFQK